MLQFSDGFDRIFPKAFQQFEQTLNGRSDEGYYNHHRSVDVIVTRCTDEIDQLKQECAYEAKLRVAALPFDMVGRTLYNGTLTVYKTGELIIRLFPLILNYSENKEDWIHTAKEIPDYAVATVLSPIQPIAKINTLVRGSWDPSYLYVPKEKLVVRRQLNLELEYKSCEMDIVLNKLEELVPILNESEDIASEQKRTAKDLLIAKALIDYSHRWCLVGRREGRESIETKIELSNKFLELLNSWHTHQKVGSEDLIRFINENFKTKKQKQVLQQFLMKPLHKIPFRFDSFAPWLRKMFKEVDLKEYEGNFTSNLQEYHKFQRNFIQDRFEEINDRLEPCSEKFTFE